MNKACSRLAHEQPPRQLAQARLLGSDSVAAKEQGAHPPRFYGQPRPQRYKPNGQSHLGDMRTSLDVERLACGTAKAAELLCLTSVGMSC